METGDISIKIEKYIINYRVSAIIKRENKILMHKDKKLQMYTLPGGRVKEGEDSIKALQREIKEEIGIETEYVRPVSFIENFFDFDNKKYHELLLTHGLKLKNENDYNKDVYEPLEEKKKNILEFIWVDLEEIDNINFLPIGLKQLIKNNDVFQHIINDRREKVNIDLKKYIEKNIFPKYKLNGDSHGINHIKKVLKRALKIAQNYKIDYNILYTVVSYHDIGDHIDRENHEKVSAEIMFNDKNLDKFFDSKEKVIIKEAIEDHRASSNREPRSIYGKIISSADKNTDIDEYLERAIGYNSEHFKEDSKEENFKKVYQHAIKKFGKNGYATKCNYVKNEDYEKYLKDLQELIEDKEEFYLRCENIYNKIVK